jgi:hypothetical protein
MDSYEEKKIDDLIQKVQDINSIVLRISMEKLKITPPIIEFEPRRYRTHSHIIEGSQFETDIEDANNAALEAIAFLREIEESL